MLQSRVLRCSGVGVEAVDLGHLAQSGGPLRRGASPVEQGYFANSCVHSGCQCAAFVLQCIYVVTEVYCSYRTKTARPERLLARSDSRDPRA